MATLRKSPNSKNWIACFRSLDGKQHNRSTKIPDSGNSKERADAKRRAQQIADRFERIARGELKRESDLRQIVIEIAGLSSATEAKAQTVREFYFDWLEAKRMEGIAEGSMSRYKGVVDAFLEQLIDRDAAPFDSLSQDDFETYRLAMLDAGRSTPTVSNHIKILRFAYTRARQLNRISYDPTAGVKQKATARHSKAAFTFDEVRLLINEVSAADYPEEWKTLILVSFLAGFAQSDAASLRWEQVDLQGSRIISTRKKTGVQVATVIPPQLSDHFLTLPTSDDPKAYLMPKLAEQKAQQRSRTFGRIMRAAGIDEGRSERKEGGRSVAARSLHSLRHAFATALQASGIDPETIAKGMGHTNTKQTQAYTHAEKERLQEAFAKMPSLLCDKSATVKA